MHTITDDEIDFETYMHVTDHQQKVRAASTYVQALMDRVNSPVREKQLYMPWGKTKNLLQFRPGEVTVWGGENGSGKSLITGQVALSLCAQDEKVGLASFEMKPTKTLERMGRQWTGFNLNDPLILCDPVERRELMAKYTEFMQWTDNKLWMYDQQGTVSWKQVCAVTRYCAKELGITQFFVDNLMKCVAGEDDYNGQKAFVGELCAIAQDENIHVHLVHHVKKPTADNAEPSKYDFKGSGAITDQVDNVIAVWRNKKKERATQTKKPVFDTDPDAKLIVDKQRNGEGWEGAIYLWYDQASSQFLAGNKHKPMEFFNPPQEELEPAC